MREKPGPPLGVLKITTSQYYRVDGESTQEKGVVPDITLPDPAAHVESGERFLDNAIPWNEVEPLTFSPWTKSRYDNKKLAEQSKERVGKVPAFAKLEERTQLLKERRARTVVPLKRDAWQSEREQDEKDLERVTLKLDDGPSRLAVSEVSYGPPSATDQDARMEKRVRAWRDNLSRDPWLEEAVLVMLDMPRSGE